MIKPNHLGILRGMLLIAGIAVCLCSYVLASIDWTQYADAPVLLQLGSLTVLQFVALSVVMFTYWLITPPKNVTTQSSEANGFAWRDYKWLIAAAIAMRLILVPVSPYTSNDVDRYLFDGKVALSGLDPYRTPHDSPAVAPLKVEWPSPPEHAKYPTLYPPGAIALYALSALTGPELAPLTWKLIVTTAGIGVMLLMLPVLAHFSLLRHFPLVALSPLLILETGIGAHVDIITAFTIVLALFYWQRNHLVACGIALGVGVVVKLMPILLLVPLCFSVKRVRDFFSLGFSCLLTIASVYLLAMFLGMQPIGSTPVFFEKWRNASPLFEVINTYVMGANVVWLIALLLTVGFAIIALNSFLARNRAQPKVRVVTMMQWSLALPLLLSPVVFPWYLMPVVVLFALRPSMFLSAWVTLIPITYLVLNQFASQGLWLPQQWPVMLLGFGLLLGFILDQILSDSSCECPPIKERQCLTVSHHANLHNTQYSSDPQKVSRK